MELHLTVHCTLVSMTFPLFFCKDRDIEARD